MINFNPLDWDETNRLLRGWLDQNKEYFGEALIDKNMFDFYNMILITLLNNPIYMFKTEGRESLVRAGEELAALFGRKVAVRSYIGFFPPKKEE